MAGSLRLQIDLAASASQSKAFGRAIARLSKFAPIPNLLLMAVRPGPSAELRARTRTHVWGEVADEKGHRAVSRLHGPEAGLVWTTITALGAAQKALNGARGRAEGPERRCEGRVSNARNGPRQGLRARGRGRDPRGRGLTLRLKRPTLGQERSPGHSANRDPKGNRQFFMLPTGRLFAIRDGSRDKGTPDASPLSLRKR